MLMAAPSRVNCAEQDCAVCIRGIRSSNADYDYDRPQLRQSVTPKPEGSTPPQSLIPRTIGGGQYCQHGDLSPITTSALRFGNLLVSPLTLAVASDFFGEDRGRKRAMFGRGVA